MQNDPALSLICVWTPPFLKILNFCFWKVALITYQSKGAEGSNLPTLYLYIGWKRSLLEACKTLNILKEDASEDLQKRFFAFSTIEQIKIDHVP